MDDPKDALSSSSHANELTEANVEHLKEIFSSDRPLPAISFREAVEPWRMVEVGVASVDSQWSTTAFNNVQPLGDLFDSLLMTPPGPKQGSAILQGAVATNPGPRADTNVSAMWGLGFDLDNI